MSKRKLVLQSAGGILGLVCLNLAFAPSASAGSSSGGGKAPGPLPSSYNCSNCSGAPGNNGSNSTGYYQYFPGCGSKCGYFEYVPFNGSNNSGFNASNGSGFYISYYTNESNGSGVKFYPSMKPNKPDEPVKPDKPDITVNPNGCKTKACDGPGEFNNPDEIKKDNDIKKMNGIKNSNSYTVGLGTGKLPGFSGGTGANGQYAASSAGLSKQLVSLLNAASNAYAEASARLAEIQSRTAPAAKKESVRYSRVADANADCGCNATAAAPDNSAELAAAKAAEAEAAASLAKAQEQARQFLEAQKQAGNNLVANQFSPLW